MEGVVLLRVCGWLAAFFFFFIQLLGDGRNGWEIKKKKKPMLWGCRVSWKKKFNINHFLPLQKKKKKKPTQKKNPWFSLPHSRFSCMSNLSLLENFDLWFLFIFFSMDKRQKKMKLKSSNFHCTFHVFLFNPIFDVID